MKRLKTSLRHQFAFSNLRELQTETSKRSQKAGIRTLADAVRAVRTERRPNTSRKIQWQYYFARKFSLQRFEVVMSVFYSAFWRDHFGVRIQNSLVKPGEGGNHEIWMDANEWPKAQQKVFKKVYKDLDTWQFYYRLMERTNKYFVRETKKVAKRGSKSISSKRLLELYNRFVFLHQDHFIKPIWIVFSTEPLMSKVAEAALRNLLERTKSMDRYDELFGLIFSPDQPNAITRLRLELLRLAYDCKTKRVSVGDRKTRLDRIRQSFEWIPCYDVIDDAWDDVYFSKEFLSIMKMTPEAIVKELATVTDEYSQRSRRFKKFLATVKLSARERVLFQIVHELVYMKDARDDHRREGSHAAQPLFDEIGRRFGLTRKHVCAMSMDETRALLRTGKGPSRALLDERINGYVLLRKNGKTTVIYSGNEIGPVLAQELGNVGAEVVEEVNGTVGAPGIAQGPVAIVRTKHDLRRVKKGDIMVSVTTNPDYVPAMRLCKAIVTDEGGITSHASIVCREWKMPCIVGTKSGTKMFKDGDQVEVDAMRGTIKRLL